MILYRKIYANKKYVLLLYISFFVLSFFIFCLSRKIIGTDDVNFANQVKEQGYFQWLLNRYFGWSGRIFSDSMTGIFLLVKIPVWALANSFFLCLLNFSMTDLIFNDHSIKKDAISLVIFFYLPLGIFVDSCSWITGSFNYLWVTSLGIFSLIFLKNEYEYMIIKNKRKSLYLFCAFLSCLGTEQLSAVMVCLTLVFIVSFYVKSKKINFGMMIFLFICLLSTFISSMSPGDKNRTVIDSKRWYPSFIHENIVKKISVGFNWELSNLVKIVFPLLIILFIIFILNFSQKQKINKILFTSSTLCFFIFSIIFTFLTLIKKSSLFNNSYISYPLKNKWAFVLFILYLFFAISLFENIKKDRIIFGSLILASFLSAAVMYFSPTIFASGARTFWITWICLNAIILKIISDNQLVNAKNLYIFMFYPFSNVLIYMFWLISEGFMPHLLW